MKIVLKIFVQLLPAKVARETMNRQTNVALITILCCLVHIAQSSLETRGTLYLTSSASSFYGTDIQLVTATNPPSIYTTAPKRNSSIPGDGGRIYECKVNFATATNDCSPKATPPFIEQKDTFPLSLDHNEPMLRACSPSKLIQCGNVQLTPGICYKSNDNGRTWSYLKSDTGTCPMEKVDLIFVLDGSDSVGVNNFETVKNWTSSLVAQFQIEKEQVRVGVIQYSHLYDNIDELDPRQFFMKTEVELGKYTSTAELINAISKIKLQKFSTFTAAALNKTVRDFKRSTRWTDPTTSKVLILLTDGSADDADKLPVTAKYVRSLDIVTFAVGVGDYKIDQLRTIATGDNESDARVYNVSGFNGLNAIISSLTSQIVSIALEGNSNDKETSTQMENSMAGFSMKSSSNGRLYLGAVGAYDWSGTVTKYDTLDDNIADIPTYEEVKKVLPNRTKESYMGYSVTTGNFEGGTAEYVATGAPRYQLMGAVVVYKPKNDNNEFNDHIRLMGRRSKRKLGSYFGGTVLAVDINGDKKDDLFVGAPLYVHETFDEGRVFVYESISGRASSLAEWKKDEPKELVGDNLPGGRFGTAMASAGDLNDDNYNDVIIGAPLVDGDRGAVFVYHGGPQGIDPAFKQKILASELSGVTLKYFGQSLQGGVDLDGNGYPDIAVGAPKSDTVVIFRARPVVKITPEIKFAGKSAIDIISCIVDHDYVNCSDITVCLTPSGTLIEPEIGLKFNVTMDTKKADADKRLEFGGDVKKFGTAKFTWSETFTVPRYRKKCFTRQVHMKRNVNDYDSVVYAEVEYELTPKHTEAAMSSLRDPSKSNKKEAELRFEQNCADSCKPDLGVTLTLDIPPYAAKDLPSKDLSQNKTIFVVDRTTTSSQLSGRVNLSNFGENAFGAKVWIRHPAEIRWSTVKVLNSYPPSNSCVVPETPSEGDDGIVTQPLKFSSKTTIMQSNSFCYFEFSLITDPLKKNGRLESFTVEAESFLTSDAPPESKDKNTKNNLQKVKTGLLYTSDMNAKEVGSGVDISFNHTRNGTRNITSIREIGNGTDDIVAQFTVLGNGYSKIPVVTAMYTYPWKNDDDEILLYLYDVRCESQNSESGTSCICERANVNSYNLSAEPPVENSTAANYFTVTRRDTLTENLQYNCINGSTSGICQTLKCTISNLGDRDEVTFKAFFRLWTDNLMLNSTEEKARLELRSQFEVNSKPSLRIIDSNGVLPLVKTLESLITARLYTTPSAPEPVADNLWIYILAAVGGLLLLIILVLLLWKLGFFKSKYADMKKDAQEDLQEETEFPDQNGS